MDQHGQASEPAPSESDRFLADTLKSLEQLEELGLEAVEPATVFVVQGDGR